jgi:predicted mannosyl-3-phosphoglycerate phosphatase (HAD superfamily)
LVVDEALGPTQVPLSVVREAAETVHLADRQRRVLVARVILEAKDLTVVVAAPPVAGAAVAVVELAAWVRLLTTAITTVRAMAV